MGKFRQLPDTLSKKQQRGNLIILVTAFIALLSALSLALQDQIFRDLAENEAEYRGQSLDRAVRSAESYYQSFPNYNAPDSFGTFTPTTISLSVSASFESTVSLEVRVIQNWILPPWTVTVRHTIFWIEYTTTAVEVDLPEQQIAISYETRLREPLTSSNDGFVWTPVLSDEFIGQDGIVRYKNILLFDTANPAAEDIPAAVVDGEEVQKEALANTKKTLQRVAKAIYYEHEYKRHSGAGAALDDSINLFCYSDDTSQTTSIWSYAADSLSYQLQVVNCGRNNWATNAGNAGVFAGLYAETYLNETAWGTRFSYHTLGTLTLVDLTAPGNARVIDLDDPYSSILAIVQAPTPWSVTVTVDGTAATMAYSEWVPVLKRSVLRKRSALR